jgi:hypothetical protein
MSPRSLLVTPTGPGRWRPWPHPLGANRRLSDWPKILLMRPALTIESRSLALHEAVARRLLETPALWERARQRIRSWRESKSHHPHFLGAWDDLLELPSEQIAQAIVDPGERGQRLRRASPFAFVLSSSERWTAWRAARRSEAGGGAALPS